MAQSVNDPIAKFVRWLEDARRVRIPNYEAMALATAAHGGKTSVRFVLLKQIDEHGFVFFTDTRSRKGRELRGNPHASLAFYWQPRGRQVRVEGRVDEVTPAEADAYWATRPRQSQIAASASYQSARLTSRTELLARCAELARKFRGCEVPRPLGWTGFRVRPDAIEFWTHRERRLHNREIYLRRARGWRRHLLQP
jgi:pyridoxamine 5'-phosphate oxidase